MKARIKITLKNGVLDPQGKAIQHALASLGFTGVNDVRQGKYIEVDLAETSETTAREQVDSLQHSVDLASESLRLNALRYQAGEATILELVDAQSTLIQARNAYVDGLSRYRLAVANLQTLTGTF